MLRQLLGKNDNINIQETLGYTALIYGSIVILIPILNLQFPILASCYGSIVKQLLGNNADLNSGN